VLALWQGLWLLVQPNIVERLLLVSRALVSDPITMTKDWSQAVKTDDLVDKILFAVANCHDGYELWGHMRKDPETFRRTVRHVLVPAINLLAKGVVDGLLSEAMKAPAVFQPNAPLVISQAPPTTEREANLAEALKAERERIALWHESAANRADSRVRAMEWARREDGSLATRSTGINEELMALDVLDLLDEWDTLLDALSIQEKRAKKSEEQLYEANRQAGLKINELQLKVQGNEQRETYYAALLASQEKRVVEVNAKSRAAHEAVREQADRYDELLVHRNTLREQVDRLRFPLRGVSEVSLDQAIEAVELHASEYGRLGQASLILHLLKQLRKETA
jgi:hypothetical protein